MWNVKCLVYLLVSLITSHFANDILQHCILLIKVVNGFLTRSIVVHRSLEEEAEEALCTVSTCSEVAQQSKVEQQWSGKNRVTTEEVYLNLHRIANPSEDVDVVPSLLVVVTRRIVVDAYLVIVLCVLVLAIA